MSDQLSPGNVPPNPLEKVGYTLDFHDEFDSPELDLNKWFPYYLPHWSSRAQTAPHYSFDNGCLILQITKDQQPWCPEYDGDIKASAIQTGAFAGPVGSPYGQLKFNTASVVREAQENVQKYLPQYGYFELRARAHMTDTDHVALWMIGYEDAPEKSSEIAICEIMGAYVTEASSRIGYGVHPWKDPAIQDEFYEDFLPIDARNYHIYAAEWTPTHIDFYVDNIKMRTIYQSATYPMQFMLSIYERPSTGTNVPDFAYPKTFTIDYVRAYQPIGGYR
jgi:hypothetical protein